MAYKYIKPVADRITQTFGVNANFYATVGQRGHNGIDYGSSYGTPIRAIADGVIAFEGWGQNHSLMGRVAGICVIIRHASHHSGYAHLSRTIVNNNQKVKQGQIIGFTGNSGLVTGPHLHFEMFPLSINTSNGYYGRVDPRPLLKLTIPTRPKYITVRVISKANVRKAPKLSAPLSGSKRLTKGVIFKAVGTVKGSSVGGNNIWYKSTRGNYVWSGNCKRV